MNFYFSKITPYLFPSRVARLINSVALATLALLSVQLGTLPTALQYLYYLVIAYEVAWFASLSFTACIGLQLLSGANGVIDALTASSTGKELFVNRSSLGMAVDLICLTIFSLVEQIVYGSYILGPALSAMAQCVYIIAMMNKTLCILNNIYIEKMDLKLEPDEAGEVCLKW
jgi:hypothetical protein